MRGKSASVLAVVALALAAVYVALHVVTPSDRQDEPATVAFYSLGFTAWTLVGAVIIRARPRHPVGWLVALVGLGALVAVTGAVYARVEPSLPARDWVYWWTMTLGNAVPGLVVFILLLFPDGTLLSRRWRPAAYLAAGATLISAVGVALSVYATAGDDAWLPGEPWLRNPAGVLSEGHPMYGGGLGWPLFLLSLLVAFVSFVLRTRRGSPGQRRQFKWLLLPGALVVAGWLSMSLAVDAAGPMGWLLDQGLLLIGLTGVPIAIGVAILRANLFDIDRFIRRSLVYTVIWAAITGVYIALAALPGVVASDRLAVEAAIVATVVATLAFEPAYRALDRLVGRLLFGERLTDLQLFARFSETMAASIDADDLGHRVAESVRQGLDVTWSRVVLQVSDGIPEHAGAAGVDLGEERTPVLTVPLLNARGGRVGMIECGPKREGEFTQRDHALLSSLARQAALGIHNARLAAELSARLDEISRQAAELAASRARIVAAQDTERERFQRDLHDGVQQEIVSLLARLGLTRAQLRRDPAAAELTLAELQAQTGQVLQDLRELAHGLHPPVLTDRGLLEALEARLARIPIGVEIHVDPKLRGMRFPGDVETGAYFFVTEGLTNAMKHAAASRVSVRLAVAGDELVVEIHDDGVGFVPADVSGTGLTGLRDRLEALGGHLDVDSRPGAGCRLAATVPITPSRRDPQQVP